VEQSTAAGDSRNLVTCEDLSPCDCVEGAATPSAVEFTNSPVPGLYLHDERLLTGRPQFGCRTDSVLDDVHDANAKFDEFGYLYDVSDDERTDISDISCEEDEFGDFTSGRDVVFTKSPLDETSQFAKTSEI